MLLRKQKKVSKFAVNSRYENYLKGYEIKKLLWLRDWPKNFKFSLEASFPGQIFFFGQHLSRRQYQPTYQPAEGVYLLISLKLESRLFNSSETWQTK